MSLDPKVVMENLIKEIRSRMPFGLSFDGACIGDCEECPEKLLEYLGGEMKDWESRLKRGQIPTEKDVEILAKDCQKIYSILEKKGLCSKEPAK